MKRKYYRPQSRAAIWSPRFGWVALLTLLGGIGLHRLGLLPTSSLPFVAAVLFVAACIALILACRGLYLLWTYGHKGGMASLRGGLLALLALVPLLFVAGMWFVLPPVNQVSTDPANPPAFLPGKRPADALPVIDHFTQQMAEQQWIAWPEVSAQRYDGSPDTILKSVLRVVDNLGWKLVGEKGDKGEDSELIVEAEATTPVMGFTSDIVIRLMDEGVTTVVDVRSASRYLQRDFGIDARFTMQFMDALYNEVLLTPVESD